MPVLPLVALLLYELELLKGSRAALRAITLRAELLIRKQKSFASLYSMSLSLLREAVRLYMSSFLYELELLTGRSAALRAITLRA